MKTVNILTLILIIVSGVNWGSIALAQTDLVAALFGVGTTLTRAVYGLVGLSALWQIMPLLKAVGTNEVAAEADSIR
jgi:uncharacterized membrane protein YuzA (DUF378 family)